MPAGPDTRRRSTVADTTSERPDRPVALVTGAARGIGAATATLLAGEGWDLGLVDACHDDGALDYRLASPADLQAVAAACEHYGRSVLRCVADVRDQPAICSAVDAVAQHFGRLDAVVCAAGAVTGGPFAWETEDVQWQAMLDINLTGVWRTARAAVPAMLATPPPRHGRFVVVASSGSTLGLPRLAAYSAAKHGVVGLVRSMAAELADRQITVNAVAPGTTDTAMARASAAVYGLSDPAELTVHHLDRRLLQPAEIASLVAWLCRPEASAITGALFAADGGMTAS